MIQTERISDIVREAGRLIAEPKKYSVHQKSGFADVVTDCDLEVQCYLIEKLGELIPGAGFLCEEKKVDIRDREYVFVIDPIDGTANFVSGYRQSGISVALLKNAQPVYGVIYNPYSDELFCAEREKGAFLNGRAIHVTERPLKNSLVSVGTSPYNRELSGETFDIIRRLFDGCMDIRRRGSAALDFCDVACGRTALMFELQLCAWDFSAAKLIVEEAGGKFRYMFGDSHSSFDSGAVVMASPEAMERFEKIIGEVKSAQTGKRDYI